MARMRLQKIAMQTLPKPEWTERSYHRKASRSDFPTGFSAIPANCTRCSAAHAIYFMHISRNFCTRLVGCFPFFQIRRIFVSRAGSARVSIWSPSQKQRMDSGKIATASPSRTQSMAPLASSQRQKISGVRFWAEKASMINFSYLRYKISGLFMRSFNRRPHSRSSRISEGMTAIIGS